MVRTLLYKRLQALAALALAASLALPAARAQEAAAPTVAFEHYTLPNGLDVILHVDRRLPVVHVNEWFHVGSKDERAGRSGFAHLFEHLMFQGSVNAAGEYFAYAEQAGANLFEGGVNGTTNFDRTNYFITVPSGNLENVLWLESDRLATLADTVTQANLDNQREVVRNERRQGLENQPYGRAWKLIYENVFPSRHPYANDVIGSHEDLQAASLDDVRAFFRQYYTPNNLSLVISGDFDPAEARRLVERYFGPIPPGPALDRPRRAPAALDGERVVEVLDRVPQERVYFAWPSPEYFGPGDAALTIAASVLGDGLTSRLNRALVYDRPLASEVWAYQDANEAAGVFIVQATARPGQELDEVERVATEAIARLAVEGPTDEELERAKARVELAFVTGLERIGGFGGKADRLNQYNTFLGRPGMFAEDLERHRLVSADDVREAVRRWVATRNRVVVRFRPETSAPPAPSDLDRAQAPPLGGDRPFQAPVVQSARLENGMDVYVVERPELPKVALQLVTRAGSMYDPAGQGGTAALVADAMRRGTGSMDALELEDAFASLGTTLSAGAGRQSAALSLDVLTRHLDRALGLVADVAQNPAFATAEVERERALVLDALAQEAADPQSVAYRVGPMLAFGADHPYGRPSRGLPATVGALDPDDLRGFHAARWRPGSSAIVLVGDITLADALPLVRRHFGGWAGGAAPAVAAGAARPMGAGRVYAVEKPGASQTVVLQVLPGVRRGAEDERALRLADAVWGGAFGARLNTNLREDKGYSYGVFSFPDSYAEGGAWMAGGGVQEDKTTESVAEFVAELAAVAGGRPVTAAELAGAKALRVRGYAQEFEAHGRVASKVAELWIHGLPMTELQREPEALNATTLDAVNAAARRYAAPRGATLLLVGDRARIEAAARAQGLGEVVFLDPEGRPETR